MPFKTGKDYVRPGVADRGAATIIELLRARGHLDELGQPVPDPTLGAPTGSGVVARLNHGRWLGDCNLQDTIRGRTCLNAQLLDPDDPRFFCVECFNGANGGRWRPVTWPANRAGIEAQLEARQQPEQNWEP
jgi:hypothetical protein